MSERETGVPIKVLDEVLIEALEVIEHAASQASFEIRGRNHEDYETIIQRVSIRSNRIAKENETLDALLNKLFTGSEEVENEED